MEKLGILYFQTLPSKIPLMLLFSVTFQCYITLLMCAVSISPRFILAAAALAVIATLVRMVELFTRNNICLF